MGNMRLQLASSGNLINQMNKYYASGIYNPNAGIGGDYVDIIANGNGIRVPARNGFMALLCSARDLCFTGYVTIDYNVSFEEATIRTYFFDNGEPVHRDNLFSGYIHGEELVLRGE